MAASFTVAEHLPAVTEGKDRDQCSSGNHDTRFHRIVTCQRMSLQRCPWFHFWKGTRVRRNVCRADRGSLFRVLSRENGLVICSGASNAGLIDRRRCLLVENRKNSAPASFSGLLQWESANADHIETTEAINELCIQNWANRHGLREWVPSLLRLTSYPTSQVLLCSRSVVRVQSVSDSTRLSDKRAQTDGSDNKGQPSRSGYNSIYEC